MTDQEAFSTQQAAALCGVDRRSMLRWVKAGVLPSFQTGGGRWRILREDLVAFMQARGMPIPADLSPEPPKVVIVDDDTGFADALRRIVSSRRPDARVLTATDGFTGGMMVSDEQPHLLLLDVQMEGIDGVEVCRRIRANDALNSVKVVIVSGFLTDEAEEVLLGLGVERCCRKPLAPAAVHEIVDAFLPPPLRVADRG